MTGMLSEIWSLQNFAPMGYVPAAAYPTVYDSGLIAVGRDIFQSLLKQVEKGLIRLSIGKHFSLYQIARAHRLMDSNNAGGKIVITTNLNTQFLMESVVQAPISNPVMVAERSAFYFDVISGLGQSFKSLPSKYFYDNVGDRLFQSIMACEEYYLTRSEEEIFKNRSREISRAIRPGSGHFDMIELGAGDGTKTIHLLNQLSSEGASFRYMPIDISGHILADLQDNLLSRSPDLDIMPLQGEYFQMLAQATETSQAPKLVMFLGSNIGNMPMSDASDFCQQLRQFLQPGDLALLGFDLVKDPSLIRAAYSDKKGITKAFNLNLLIRINQELGANFNLDLFDHYCSYDPETGACKSYLVSQQKHTVVFPKAQIDFDKGECIWMEISQKYSLPQVDQLAARSGFESIECFTDSNAWFADVVWKAV